MATIRRRGSGSWEVVIRRKGVLNKAHYATADSQEQAEAYARRIELQLDQGILPVELADSAAPVVAFVADWCRDYLRDVPLSESDAAILNALLPVMAGWPVADVSMEWAQRWVASLKRADRLAPGTIRHKVGAVARLLDWVVRNGWILINPLRQLPKRYASYSAADGDKKTDIERDRRLLPGEEARLYAILAGVCPQKKQRGIVEADRWAWNLLFLLAIETAMRLREMYTLTMGQIDLDKRTIFLDKTKNGDKRQVPLSSVAVLALGNCLAAATDKNALLLPFWDGRPESLRRTTTMLSRKWSTIARLAECEELRFHDLRHEACCRLYERTRLGDVQIARITGHKDLRMLKRYSNLRGSDLAEMLW